MSKEVRLQICRILDNECGSCNRRGALGMGVHEFEVYCLNKCPVGTRLQELGEKIGGEKPPEQFKWTRENEALLINLRKRGVTYERISREFGISRGALAHKYSALKKKAGGDLK